MAPKRKLKIDRREKGKGQASSDSRFVSQAAQERYEKFAKQPGRFIEERGLVFTEALEGITDVIQALGWGKFCKEPPAPAISSVVKEFYANAPESTDGRTLVRGKEIVFTAAAINDFYELPQVGFDDDAYAAFKQQVDFDAVINTLTEGRATWFIAAGEHIRFESKFLDSISRMWLYFVASRLMPSKHMSTVSKARAILMYAIRQKMRMNVGEIIYQEITHSAKRSKTGFYFPHLITALCTQAEVPLNVEEIFIPPGVSLTVQFMQNLTSGGRVEVPRTKSSSMSRLSQKDQLLKLNEDIEKVKQQQNRQEAWMTWMSGQMRVQHEMQRLQLAHAGIVAPGCEWTDFVYSAAEKQGDVPDEDSEESMEE